MSRASYGIFCIGLWATACTNQQGNISSIRQDFETEPIAKTAFDAVFREACGDGGMSAAGDDAFLRTPYLQKMTADSVEILWTTALADATRVEVRTPEGELVAESQPSLDDQSDRPEFEQYVAEIGDLDAETIYCYEIHGDNDVWLASTGFRTAPAFGSTAPVRFVALGDLGSQTSDQFAVLSAMENVAYDFVLVPGDLAYERGTLADHERGFFEVYGDLLRSVPFFVISGNHDYAADGAVFREVFSLPENGGPGGVERWYSFDWGDTHLVALDTERVDDVQAQWLDADLEANPLSRTIAFMHRPAFSSGSHGSTASVQHSFVPLFEKHGVDLVLAGHDHNYERTSAIGGVTYVVTGGGGRGTRPVGASDFTEYAESVAHFSYITIDPQRDELELHAIDATGRDFDEAVIKEAPAL